MRDFVDTLKNVMNVVSNQLELLPASDSAIVDMTYPDAEERDDTRLASDNLIVEVSLEKPSPNWKYREIKPIPRKEKHFFRYFLDGSYRHYFLATGLEHDRATPIFLSQIAVAIITRDDEGKLSTLKDFRRHQWFLLISKSRISETAWENIQESMKQSKINIIIRDLDETDALSGELREGQDLKERGRSKTRAIMTNMEFETVKEFRNSITEGWIIKDGVISFGLFGGIRSPQVIGVAKSFTSVQKFYHLGSRLSVVSLLGNLPPFHRTPAFSGFQEKVVFWYLRLRKSQELLYPLFGVIKIELPVLEEQPITTELIDEISGALLAEQFVTPYGSDDRWHSHLYPIYQAEHASKQLFYSTQVIQGCIKNALRR